MSSSSKILFIGCGKMGGAIFDGLLAAGHSEDNLYVVDPRSDKGVNSHANLSDLPAEFIPDLILLAFKPQDADDILPELAKFSDSLFVSIMAGKSVATISSNLGEGAKIIRAMPNLPATVGRGMTALYSSDAEGRELVESVFQSCGEVVWVDSEEMLNAATAISGSGPAYVFLFMEALQFAAEELGFDAATAKKLALSTIAGAAELASESNDNFSTLRQNVTSKAGTTEAALQQLMRDDALQQLLAQATRSAKLRAEELSS